MRKHNQVTLLPKPVKLADSICCFNHQVQKSKCEEAIKVAIELGFRLIDGAFIYGNEEEIGQGMNAKIADGTVKRDELFYTGKVSKY